ncbi:MAG TPA: hypothetical protein VKR53_11645 [Puia sp.]|nr:hypothetical protein [Puia sp.]
MRKKIRTDEGRIYYGISWMDQNGDIIYKAAVNELENGEAEKFGWESFTIRKGTYISEVVADFMKNISGVRETFMRLLKVPHLDTNGYWVEIYFDQKDVRCMVTLGPLKSKDYY